MGDTTQQNLAGVDIFGTSAAGALNMVAAYQNSRSRKRAADRKARQARTKGEDELRISGVRTGRLYGAQRAAYAANGVDVSGSVTVRDVLADTSEEGLREAVQIRSNSAEEARGYRAEAASESPLMDALGAGLGAAGTVAGKWYKYQTSGVFDTAKKKERDNRIYI